MADVTIPGLTTLSSVDRAADYFEVSDTSDSGNSKKTSVNSMLDLASHPVGVDDTQTLTAKTLTSPTINTPTLAVNDNAFTIRDNSDTTKIIDFQLSGITTGNTRTLTIPDASITLVGTAATQTLTNKTLTGPTINNPTLAVDTISEFTGANGVTIDGLNIKDSALNTNNSVPNNAWNNTGSFGSSWAWTSFVPSWTNLTPGSGTNTGHYTQIGKRVIVKTKFVFGSGSAVGTAPTLTLPITASSNSLTAAVSSLGEVSMLDSGSANYMGVPRYQSTTTVILVALNVAGTYASHSSITSTAPMTWTTNDELHTLLVYEAA